MGVFANIVAQQNGQGAGGVFSRVAAQNKTAVGSSPLPAIGSSIVNAFQSGIQQMKEGFQQGGPGARTPLDVLEGGTKLAAGGINVAFSPLAPIFSPIGKLINAASERLSGIPAVQKFAQSPAGNVTSRIAEDVGNLSTIFGAVAPFTKTGEVISSASTIGNKVKTAVGERNAARLEKSAINDATPAYSKKVIGQPTVGEIPRVQEGGFFKSREVTPTSSNIEAGQELRKIQNYPQNGTALEKYNAIGPEIKRQAEALRSSLKNENVLRPPQEIYTIVRKAVNTAADNSLLLQKTDPIVKNYLRVAERAIKQSNGTLEGEMDIRQKLDDAYEKAGGKYANEKGLDQIHRSARDALNTDLEAKATNTEVKASFKRQTNLYNASDVLKDKARAENPTGIGRFGQRHPIISKISKTGAKAAGVGAGLHLIP